MHIADKMQGSGKLVALDRSASRVKKLQEVIEKQNLGWVQVCHRDAGKILDGQQKKPRHPEIGFVSETFDRVLLDAPCSCLGQRCDLILMV